MFLHNGQAIKRGGGNFETYFLKFRWPLSSKGGGGQGLIYIVKSLLVQLPFFFVSLKNPMNSISNYDIQEFFFV